MFAKYVHSNGLKLSGDLEEFSITSQFLGYKCKNYPFEAIKRLKSRFFFIELKFR